MSSQLDFAFGLVADIQYACKVLLLLQLFVLVCQP